MKLKFSTLLISGAGNTFHILYGRANEIKSAAKSNFILKEIAKNVCDKVKADGFIFLEKQDNTQPNKFSWHFYNNDGSDAEMCGNATRCVGYFVEKELHPSAKEFLLQTIAGEILVEILSPNRFKVRMSPIKDMESSLGFQCDTGVPHLVLPFASGPLFKGLTAELREASKNLRFHPSAGPRGSNVTYVQESESKDKVYAVSYERGVEDFTAACGTGAMAAAYFVKKNKGIDIVRVEMPGGELIMDLSNLNQPVMTGPATLLGRFDHEFEL